MNIKAALRELLGIERGKLKEKEEGGKRFTVFEPVDTSPYEELAARLKRERPKLKAHFIEQIMRASGLNKPGDVIADPMGGGQVSYDDLKKKLEQDLDSVNNVGQKFFEWDDGVWIPGWHKDRNEDPIGDVFSGTNHFVPDDKGGLDVDKNAGGWSPDHYDDLDKWYDDIWQYHPVGP
jgi:hypothetical protein